MAVTDNNTSGKQGTPNPNGIEDYNETVRINTNLIIGSDETNESFDDLIKDGKGDIVQLREEGAKEENKQKYRVGIGKKFFWWCAGADQDLLTMCPSDHSKYVGVGTTIFFTALMAFFSCFIAMDFVFDNKIVAFFIATCWCAMIFSLDRFITNTMYSDGKVTISKDEFFGGLPRIVIAIILGIVISAPLELKIFEKKIKMDIETQRRTERTQKENEAKTNAEADFNRELEILNGKRIDFENQGNRAKNRYDSLKLQRPQDKYVSWRRGERSGTYNSKRIEQEQWDSDNQSLLSSLNDAQRVATDSITKINGQIVELEQKRRDKIDSTISDYLTLYNETFDTGIGRQLRTLHDIAMSDYESWKDENGNETIWNTILLHRLWYYLSTAQGLIMLLFILIDISPVLYKMMLADGEYDKYLQDEQILASEKRNIRQAKILNYLDKSELKRVEPFVTEEMYTKMAGDYFVYKTESDFKKERDGQHNIAWIWRIFPFSLLRFLFWKEEDTPSAPKIEFNRTDDEIKKALKDKNKEVFEYVLKLKAEILKGAYKRWYEKNGGKE